MLEVIGPLVLACPLEGEGQGNGADESIVLDGLACLQGHDLLILIDVGDLKLGSIFLCTTMSRISWQPQLPISSKLHHFAVAVIVHRRSFRLPTQCSSHSKLRLPGAKSCCQVSRHIFDSLRIAHPPCRTLESPLHLLPTSHQLQATDLLLCRQQL